MTDTAVDRGTGGRKGRPRDERIDEQITAAALQVLADVGFERFSVEQVAAQAGVAKTTLYRRFPCRDDLVVGALLRMNDALPEPPPAGPVRDRLVRVLAGIRRRAASSDSGRLFMRVVTEGHAQPALAAVIQERVLEPRRQVLRDVIADGVASGELHPDLDPGTVIPVLVGPMLYLGMWDGMPGQPGVSVESVVDAVLAGLAAPSAR